MTILQNIEWTFDEKEFFKASAIDDDELVYEARRFTQFAVPLLKPKAVYDELFVEDLGENTVTIGGVTFTSAMLRKNLEGIHRVFPFIVTCGNELEGIDLSGFDFLAVFWLDTIKEMAVKQASAYLEEHVSTISGFKKLASMNPGSGNVDLWPIQQQKQLFSLFPHVTEDIGVTLTRSFLMVPNKSISGIFFPSEVNYMNCKYCTRENCPNRRASFKGEEIGLSRR
ncbi:MAG TPA: vitamin B12 dependent-methionine synthase activation domain-containing protein [Spirochaetia bacterium]|nr:vitamin B12 dependent-methionine synthase activation domain-containing protein [Spirochaetia bacterium]